MNTIQLLESTLEGMFPILSELTDYEVKQLPSLRKTIDRYSSTVAYEETLDYFLEKDEAILKMAVFLQRVQEDSLDTSYRLKTEQSFKHKWTKNLGSHKQLREICNDVIGIRFIVDATSTDIKAAVLNTVERMNYNIDIIDMYEKPKTIDDGYRAIHIYFREQPKCFPIEIQLWTFQDAILHFYTHEVIYKNEPTADSILYSLALRNAIDSLPIEPKNVDLSFINYLYKVVHANYGGE